MSATSAGARRGLPIAAVLIVALFGGLHAAAARAKIQREVVASLNRPVTVTAGTKTWTLSPREAGLTVDTANMVAQAVRASREGSIVTRTIRGLSDGHVNRDVPLVISYSHGAVRGAHARPSPSSAIPEPRTSATAQPSASGLTETEGRTGTIVDSTQLGARIDRALTGAARSHTVVVPVKTVQPAVSTAQLAEKYPAYIVIDRGAFRLRFYEHLKLARTYEIAVGMEGLETPAGLHKIEWEQVDPPWYVPKKAWAGALAGTVVPPGPADPCGCGLRT